MSLSAAYPNEAHLVFVFCPWGINTQTYRGQKPFMYRGQKPFMYIIAIFVPRGRYNGIFRTSRAAGPEGSKNRRYTNPEVRTMVFLTRVGKA